MKLLISFLMIAFFSSVGMAGISADNEYLLNHDGLGWYKAQLGSLVQKTTGMLEAKYSFAVQGGSTTADIKLITDLTKRASYAVLPNHAIVKRVWLDVVTQPTSGGAATFAVKAQTAADLKSASAVSALTVGFHNGVPVGTTTTWIKLTADRTVTATIGSQSPVTAGKVNVYIEYEVGD